MDNSRVPLDDQPVPDNEVPFLHECYTHTTSDCSDGTMVWGSQVDMTEFHSFLKSRNATAETLLTPTAILAHAVGVALKKHPAANCRILGSRIYHFTEQNVVLPVLSHCGPRLILLRRVDERTYGDIASELREAVTSRVTKTMEITPAERIARRLPAWLRGIGVRTLLWMANRFRLPMRPITRHLIAAPVIINHFGFRCAPPMLAYKPSRFGSHSLLLNVTLGPTHPQPVVRDNTVVVRPVSGLFVRVDHRTMDGGQLSSFVRTLIDVLENPGGFEVKAPLADGSSLQPAQTGRTSM